MRREMGNAKYNNKIIPIIAMYMFAFPEHLKQQ